MIQELREEIISDFKGTIIDIETIGEFNGRYRNSGDWREYEGIQQVIFGLCEQPVFADSLGQEKRRNQ